MCSITGRKWKKRSEVSRVRRERLKQGKRSSHGFETSGKGRALLTELVEEPGVRLPDVGEVDVLKRQRRVVRRRFEEKGWGAGVVGERGNLRKHVREERERERAHLFETIRLGPELVKSSIRLQLERLVDTEGGVIVGHKREGRREEGKGKVGRKVVRQNGWFWTT